MGAQFVESYIQRLVYVEMILAVLVHVWLTKKIRREFYSDLQSNELKLGGLSKEQQLLVEQVNSQTTREKIIERFPKLQWILLKDRIVDLSNWLHPGG